MSQHVFGAILTHFGTAANNRGLTEGNITTLQKLVWHGKVHTTVSAEAIRFALRRLLDGAEDEGCNRKYDDVSRANPWQADKFQGWADGKKVAGRKVIDDDLLGFMSAEGAAEEGGKGSTKVRRAVLEVTRAVSISPWPGDVTFNAASPGATPSAQKKGINPVPYGTEMHATRYQYGFALTPSRLAVPGRAAHALNGLCGLGEVAGNHGRFLYDFSPESVLFRITDDPAPRILYSFEALEGDEIGVLGLLRKVESGDIRPAELVIGGAIVDQISKAGHAAIANGKVTAKGILAGALLFPGVKAACAAVCERVAGEK